MDPEEEIQSNTCEVIKVSQLFVKDVRKLEKEFEKVKEELINQILKEIIDEIQSAKVSKNSWYPENFQASPLISSKSVW